MPAVFNVPVVLVPLAVLVPVQLAFAGLALAVQDVGVFVAFQLMVELLPTRIELGLTVMDICGALGITETITLSKLLPVSLLHVMV